MQLTRIEKENETYFAHLLPEEYLSDEKTVKLGVIDDEEEAAAAGVLSVNDRMAELRWLYTDPEKRERGAGTFLLDGIFEILQGMKLSGIEAMFSAKAKALDTFLAGQGFLVGEDTGIYAVPIMDLVYGREIERVLESIGEERTAQTLEKAGPSPEFKKIFDERGLDLSIFEGVSPKFSVLRKDENGVPTGGLFVSEYNEEDLFVNYFLSDGSVRTVCEIICAFQEALISEGKTGGKLYFTDRQENSVTLVEKLTEYERETYRVPGMMHAISLFV